MLRFALFCLLISLGSGIAGFSGVATGVAEVMQIVCVASLAVGLSSLVAASAGVNTPCSH
ncbi:MAG: hypothetical protein KDA38_08255 [Planctomycetales bacterium]|nr:hypothetical protein [Planctomycetales bacterium]